jgi:hypothetical protein
MPDFLYFIWAILPIALLWMTLQSGTKTALKTGKRDYPKNYFKELAFCSAAFVASIFLDKTMLAEESSFKLLLESLGIDHRLVRWLIYPAIIVLASVINQYFIDKKRKEDNKEKVARRMKYAPK